jgi:hypothetical protein
MIGVFILAAYALALGPIPRGISVKKTLRQKQLEFLSGFNEAARSRARERQQRSWRGTKAHRRLRAPSSRQRKNSGRMRIRTLRS